MVKEFLFILVVIALGNARPFSKTVNKMIEPTRAQGRGFYKTRPEGNLVLKDTAILYKKKLKAPPQL